MNQVLANLRERIEIDRNELEIELEKQASLHLEVGELKTDARNSVRELELSLKFKQAELDASIRKNPALYGIEKLTNPAVDSAILRDKDYRELENRLLQAQKLFDHFQILLSTVEERRSTLKDLTSLYIYNYYISNPGNEKDALKGLADKRYTDWKSEKYGEGENG